MALTNKGVSSKYKVSIICVNYNTEVYIANLINCCNLQSMNKNEFELILVNNSQNNLLNEIVDEIQHEFKILVVQSKENIGFGRANNLGANHASGEYLLLINPDITIDNPEYLNELYEFSKNNPQHGIVSTKVLDMNGITSGPFFEYAYNVKYDLPGKIASVIGALMFISSKIFQEVGGFDPDFFLYDEESDLCLRIRRLNYSIHQIDSLSVVHVGGVSETVRHEYEYWVKRQRGLYLFCHKHYTKEHFTEILNNDVAFSKKRRFKLWVQVNIFKIKRKKVKYDMWCAIYDCAMRTLESKDWLYFK